MEVEGTGGGGGAIGSTTCGGTTSGVTAVAVVVVAVVIGGKFVGELLDTDPSLTGVDDMDLLPSSEWSE